MHPNRGADDSVQLLPFVWFVCFWRVFGLDRVYLTLDYEIVLHHDGVQPVGSTDIVLARFEHESDRFRGLLRNLLRVTMVIGWIEPTGLPEYYLVRVSTISF